VPRPRWEDHREQIEQMIGRDRHDHRRALGTLPPIGCTVIAHHVHELAPTHVDAAHGAERGLVGIRHRRLIVREHDLGSRIVREAPPLRRHIAIAWRWHVRHRNFSTSRRARSAGESMLVDPRAMGWPIDESRRTRHCRLPIRTASIRPSLAI